jgi:hypothetical protein
VANPKLALIIQGYTYTGLKTFWGGDSFDDVSTEGNITLQNHVKMWTARRWLRTGSNGGLSWPRRWTLAFHTKTGFLGQSTNARWFLLCICFPRGRKGTWKLLSNLDVQMARTKEGGKNKSMLVAKPTFVVLPCRHSTHKQELPILWRNLSSPP